MLLFDVVTATGGATQLLHQHLLSSMYIAILEHFDLRPLLVFAACSTHAGRAWKLGALMDTAYETQPAP